MDKLYGMFLYPSFRQGLCLHDDSTQPFSFAFNTLTVQARLDMFLLPYPRDWCLSERARPLSVITNEAASELGVLTPTRRWCAGSTYFTYFCSFQDDTTACGTGCSTNSKRIM